LRYCFHFHAGLSNFLIDVRIHMICVYQQARGRHTSTLLNPVCRKAKWVGRGHSRAGTVRFKACVKPIPDKGMVGDAAGRL
jgi:hypothetical protein